MENVDRNKQKKRVLVTLGVIAAVGVLSALLLAFSDELGSWLSSLGSEGDTPAVDGKIVFSDPDYNEWQLAYYEELDRLVYYSMGGETVVLTADNKDVKSEAAYVFAPFFEAMTAGDADGLNALFSEAYFSKNSRFDGSFRRQLAYDIRVTFLSEETVSGTTTATFSVEYKLYKNNGTYRRDVGSDASRPQIFTVSGKTGAYLIDSVKTVYAN